MAGTVDLLREGVVVQDIFHGDLLTIDVIVRMGNHADLHSPEAVLRELRVDRLGNVTATRDHHHQVGGRIKGAALRGRLVAVPTVEKAADIVTQVAVGLPERKEQRVC
jgi:hypothetical protein